MPLRLLETIAVNYSIRDIELGRGGTVLYAPTWENRRVGCVDVGGGFTGSFDLPGRPTAIAVSPDERTAMVPATQREPEGERGKVYVVDLTTHRVTATLPVGNSPGSAAFSPDGSRGYVSTYDTEEHGGGNVYVFRTEDWLLLATIAVGEYAHSVALSPDGRRVFTSCNFARGSLAIIDADTNQLSGYVTGMGGDPTGIAVNPNGILVYVASLADKHVNIVDTSTGTSTEWIDVGFDPHSLVINEWRAEMYVAHNRHLPSASGLVIVIDLHTHQVVQRVDVDGHAGGMAVSSDGRRLYCATTPTEVRDRICVFAID